MYNSIMAEAGERVKVKLDYTIRNTRPDLVKRVREHMGEEFLDMSPEMAARYDTADQINSDPRSQCGAKAIGEMTATGGSGPKKKSKP